MDADQLPDNPFFHDAQQILPRMQAVRRDLHRHPELGMQETRTARVVAEHLSALGLEVQRDVGGTGVVAMLSAREGTRCVALRADMDALPMLDKKTVAYASTTTGAAHCCGHDGHTAMLLGAADLLCRHAKVLQGNVKFIFQPSEDRTPGGALPMIEAGVLKNPEVEGIFSLHLNPAFPQGTVAVKPGHATISSAGFVLTMIGKGGHVAYPHETLNPIGMAAMVIAAGQSVVSQKVNPIDPAIVAFASVHGGTADNIIPEEVTLTGTIRTVIPAMRQKLAAHLEEIAAGAARLSGGKYRLAVTMGYPAVFNHPQLASEFSASATRIVPAERLLTLQAPSLTGEDVAYFHQEIPGVHWQLGIADPARGYIHPLHSPYFDFNEEVMALGAALHAQCAADFLDNRRQTRLTWPWP